MTIERTCHIIVQHKNSVVFYITGKKMIFLFSKDVCVAIFIKSYYSHNLQKQCVLLEYIRCRCQITD